MKVLSLGSCDGSDSGFPLFDVLPELSLKRNEEGLFPEISS